jgi:MFS family permease
MTIATARPRYTWTTIGAFSLVFLAAFESLAVTTIMPLVTVDLHGRSLYSLAFAATLATSVVGTVAGGGWSDRAGPARPLFVAIGTFTAGLLVAGTAGSMTVFVAGRALQGFGAGGIAVALYVVVAKVYPPAMHARVFGLLAAAWVVPSLVGPFVAGAVAETWSWHWVFLGVVILVALATAAIAPSVKDLRSSAPEKWALRKIAASVVVAGAVLALSLDTAEWITVPVALIAIAAAIGPLVPPGTLRGHPGLPAAILLCLAAGATFFGSEVYLPLLLQERYGEPVWLSGLALTAAAISWSAASHLQSRFRDRLSDRRAMLLGTLLLAGGVTAELLTALLSLPAPAVGAGWFVAGAGMGTIYPRLAALVLAYSKPGEEGFNSAAKNMGDSLGGSVSLALTGLLFAAGSYSTVFTFTTLIGAAGVLVALRVVVPSRGQ